MFPAAGESTMASFFYQDENEAHNHKPGHGHLKPVPSTRAAPRATLPSGWSDSRPSTLQAERRTQVAPPDLFARSPSTLGQWLRQGWTWLWDLEELPQRPAPTTGLTKARNEFHSAIWDLQSNKANQLREHISQARSLRELWHLRADLFKLVAMHRGQAEAQCRLDVLDHHFPVRSSASPVGKSRKVTAW